LRGFFFMNLRAKPDEKPHEREKRCGGAGGGGGGGVRGGLDCAQRLGHGAARFPDELGDREDWAVHDLPHPCPFYKNERAREGRDVARFDKNVRGFKMLFARSKVCNWLRSGHLNVV
jgi:hypothetical protein